MEQLPSLPPRYAAHRRPARTDTTCTFWACRSYILCEEEQIDRCDEHPYLDIKNDQKSYKLHLQVSCYYIVVRLVSFFSSYIKTQTRLPFIVS